MYASQCQCGWTSHKELVFLRRLVVKKKKEKTKTFHPSPLLSFIDCTVCVNFFVVELGQTSRKSMSLLKFTFLARVLFYCEEEINCWPIKPACLRIRLAENKLFVRFSQIFTQSTVGFMFKI